METSLLLPAGIGVFYALLILVSWKVTAQKSKAIQIRASFITSEKYITVSWGKPQSFDTAPCVAVLLPDFGSTGRLPGSDRF